MVLGGHQSAFQFVCFLRILFVDKIFVRKWLEESLKKKALEGGRGNILTHTNLNLSIPRYITTMFLHAAGEGLSLSLHIYMLMHTNMAC